MFGLVELAEKLKNNTWYAHGRAECTIVRLNVYVQIPLVVNSRDTTEG